MTRGLCLDAGALLAVERGSRRVLGLLEGALARGLVLAVPAGVVAQAWRGGARQPRLAAFLGAREVRCVALDEPTARAVGELCAQAGATDVVGAHVAFHARRQGLSVVTSDPADIERFAPGVPLIVV